MSTFMMLAQSSATPGRYNDVEPVTLSYTAAVTSSVVPAKKEATAGTAKISPAPALTLCVAATTVDRVVLDGVDSWLGLVVGRIERSAICYALEDADSIISTKAATHA